MSGYGTSLMENLLQYSTPSKSFDHSSFASFSNSGIEYDAKLKNQILKESFDNLSTFELTNVEKVSFHWSKRALASFFDKFCGDIKYFF